MSKQQAEKLFEKYRNGKLTRAERLELEAWYNYHAKEASPLDDSLTFDDQIKSLDSDFPFTSIGVERKVKIWPVMIAAASTLLLAAFGFYFFSDNITDPKASSVYVHDIKPGGNKAYLILSDGKRIDLSDQSEGEIARQAGIIITKSTDGQIVYHFNGKQKSGNRNQTAYNTIVTPNGGQYNLSLPDGSKVWLNAATEIKFPASFHNLKERRIELNGEAYFEIAKDKSKPFLVATEKQLVTVLGTQFNVNSYADESSTKTTLLEGSVKIVSNNSSKVLKPGEQAEVTDKINITRVNANSAMSWKEGYFNFDDESLESVMKKISRWYDVEVTYQDNTVKNELYAAVTTRFANVSGLLKMLEQTGDARFQIVGKKIIISKK